MRRRLWIFLLFFTAISINAHAQKRISSGYDIRFKDHLQVNEPFRLSRYSREASIVFHAERRWIPAEGSELRLFIRHSPTLDSSRSFLSVSLNYGLLRSLRLDDQNESSTEIVIPIDPDLLNDNNELILSAQLFPLHGQESSELWAEISDRSYLRIATKEQPPPLDLRNLPIPLIDAYSYRDQRLDVLVSERASTATLEATALTIANLVSRVAPGRPLVQPVPSIRASSNPLLIVGTLEEQPELRRLQSRLSGTDTATLITKTANNHVPILIITGKTSGDTLNTANALFGGQSETSEREWRGFVPSRNHFALGDLGLGELRIRPGVQGAALIRLNVMPDTQFLGYGMQADLTIDLGQSDVADNSYIEALVNEHSIGRFSVVERLVGSQVSLRLNAPRDVLKNSNDLRIVWWNGEESNGPGGEGWILSSSAFYLPRYYAAALPDLALLQYHLFPFSLKADLSDTVLVIPDTPSRETIAGLFELAANLGRLATSERLAFKVRPSRDLTQAMKSNAHMIVLDVGKAAEGKTVVSGLETARGDKSFARYPVIQEVVSPWNSSKYVLRIAANQSGNLQEVVRRFFTDGTLDRLEGDTVYLTPSRPVTFRLAPSQTVGEHFYLTQLEAWLKLNWIALPFILAAVSGLLFLGVRIALNHYKANAS